MFRALPSSCRRLVNAKLVIFFGISKFFDSAGGEVDGIWLRRLFDERRALTRETRLISRSFAYG